MIQRDIKQIADHQLSADNNTAINFCIIHSYTISLKIKNITQRHHNQLL